MLQNIVQIVIGVILLLLFYEYNLLLKSSLKTLTNNMSMISFNEFNQSYREEGAIGNGSFGQILKIRNIRNNELFALKKLMPSKLAQKYQALKQIQILTKLKHPLITQIICYYQVQINNGFFKSGIEIGIIMEIGKYSLKWTIQNQMNKIKKTDILEFAIEFISMLEQLENQNIVHRDIKPANIIVFDDPLRCKLADFGLCCKINRIPSGVAGSFHYASPKLKKRFAHPKANIITNPFKDDVYSFGLTLFQLITRQIGREDIIHSYKQILQSCGCNELAEIVELMLEPEEEKRPTFHELSEIMNKYNLKKEKIYFEKFHNQIKLEQIMESELIYERTHKTFCCKQEINWQLQLIDECKTVKKQQLQRHYRIQSMYLKEISICSIAMIENFVICGCTDGQIRAINIKDAQKIINLGIRHKKYVSVLYVSQQGDIWSAGGDNCLRLIRKKSLLSVLEKPQPYHQEVLNMFTQQNLNNKYFQVPIEECQAMQIPFQHKGGCSALFIIDDEHFIIGFYDGFVYVLWSGQQYHTKMHESTVSCVQMKEGVLYCGGIDGVLKSLDLRMMKTRNKIYSIGSPIISFQNYDDGIGIVTLTGCNQFISSDLNTTFKSQLPVRNVLCCVIGYQQCFIVSQDGEISDNHDIIYRNEGQGWNCMCWGNEQCVVMGSFTGHITFIRW